jgi:hypothetical protein
MSRARPSFAVSCSQGMGNRETTANLLAENDLQSPNCIGQKTASGKRKSGGSSLSAKPPSVGSLAPLLKVDRVFQPQAAALDALVDVLHLLLVDGPESPNSPSSAGPEPTCFLVEPE